mgnify:CR=1 FL=1
MEINLKIDTHLLSNKILKEILDDLKIECIYLSPTIVKLKRPLDAKTMEKLIPALNSYGIAIVENQKEIIVQKIKNLIVELVKSDQFLIKVNTSSYLATSLGYSYGYLSGLFSEVTLTTIENYLILQKIEMVKLYLNEMTVSEVANKMNYSSVAHLSAQFKKITGLSPTAFQKILKMKRRAIPEDKAPGNKCD